MKIRLMWMAGVALALVLPAEAKDQTGAKIVLGVLGVVLLLVPPVVFYLAGRVRAKAAQAQNWASAGGTVTAVSVEHHRGQRHGGQRRNAFFVPKIAYRFQVGRQEFTGKRLKFGPVSFRSHEKALAAIADYRVDGPITVRYDSNNPADNVVKAEADTRNLTLMAWIFVGLDVVLAAVAAAALLGKG